MFNTVKAGQLLWKLLSRKNLFKVNIVSAERRSIYASEVFIGDFEHIFTNWIAIIMLPKLAFHF